MAQEQASFDYNLGNGSFLHLFAVDPAITRSELINVARSSDGTAPSLDLESLAEAIPIKAVLPSLQSLEIRALDERYSVPRPLQPFRKSLDAALTSKGMFNGNIMVVKGDIEVPLTLYKGGFFDFKATQLSAIPADLLPDLYPDGKTVGELLPEYGLKASDMARYLGFAFIMLPDSKNEVSWVQRAKGLGIAADCMALSGATPPFNEGFFQEKFDFAKYFRQVIDKELGEEYRISPNEIEIGACYLMEDKKSGLPFVAIEIITPLSTREIAKRSFGDVGVIKEHPILFSASFSAVPDLIRRFPLLPSSAYLLNEVTKPH